MSIASAFKVEDGLFVPFRTEKRGLVGGPVGTLHVAVDDVGAAGGGNVEIAITMRRLEFGFRCIWVPTYAVTRDTLATAEVVRFAFEFTGNERLSRRVQSAKLAITASNVNYAAFTELAVVIDPDKDSDSNVIKFLWSTNVDTKIYEGEVFGPVFDAEVIRREGGGGIRDILAGVR